MPCLSDALSLPPGGTLSCTIGQSPSPARQRLRILLQPHHFSKLVFSLKEPASEAGLLERDVGGTGHNGETELPSPCAASSHVLGFELLTPTREGDRQELLSGRGRSWFVSNCFAPWNHQGPEAKILNLTMKSSAILTVSLGEKMSVYMLCFTAFKNELKWLLFGLCYRKVNDWMRVL